MDIIIYLWYALLFGWLFVVGCAVGSFLNVVIYRLPRGKNLLWPSSRCGRCFTPIPLYHNVPLVSYWRLRGRCAACRAPFSMRYFWVEFLTGTIVAGLYALEVGFNVPGHPVWLSGGFSSLAAGRFPPHSWALLIGHGALAAMLLVAAACLLDGERLPPALVVTGALAGLAWSLLYPWPTPVTPRVTPDLSTPGFVPAPVWWLPAVLPPGGVALGLATGLGGLLLVPWLVRLVGLLTRRDLAQAAGVLTMAGGFLGWQVLLVAVASGCVLALVARAIWRTRRNAPSPPGPLSLVGGGSKNVALSTLVGVAVAWLCWRWIGPAVLPYLVDPLFAPLAVAAVAALLWAVSLLSPGPRARAMTPGFTPPAAG